MVILFFLNKNIKGIKEFLLNINKQYIANKKGDKIEPKKDLYEFINYIIQYITIFFFIKNINTINIFKKIHLFINRYFFIF